MVPSLEVSSTFHAGNCGQNRRTDDYCSPVSKDVALQTCDVSMTDYLPESNFPASLHDPCL